MSDRAIGVFDSGLGGLTVLEEIKELLPNENIIYFGDTARVPYGSKTSEQIREYTIEAMNFFVSKNVKVVVIACNTATASALEDVNRLYDIPVIGVIKPGAKAVSKNSKNKKIAVIATQATVNSKAYEIEIAKQDDKVDILSKACPSFVSLVEEGLVGTSVSYGIVREVLSDLKNSGFDAMVLGCTHYPHLEKEIREVMGPDVELINPAKETSHDLKNLLCELGIVEKRNKPGKCEYYVSKHPESFKEIAQGFMKFKIDKVEELKKSVNSDWM